MILISVDISTIIEILYSHRSNFDANTKHVNVYMSTFYELNIENIHINFLRCVNWHSKIKKSQRVINQWKMKVGNDFYTQAHVIRHLKTRKCFLRNSINSRANLIRWHNWPQWTWKKSIQLATNDALLSVVIVIVVA